MANTDIDIDQKDLFKYANIRVKQKKRLVYHFVFFIAGILVLMFLNIVLGYGYDFEPLGLPWFVSAALVWAVFLIAHFINVFFVEKLMGKAWEEKYMNKLVELQLKKLQKLQTKVDKKYPIIDPEHSIQSTNNTLDKNQ